MPLRAIELFVQIHVDKTIMSAIAGSSARFDCTTTQHLDRRTPGHTRRAASIICWLPAELLNTAAAAELLLLLLLLRLAIKSG
jgi:hypothetical protein